MEPAIGSPTVHYRNLAVLTERDVEGAERGAILQMQHACLAAKKRRILRLDRPENNRLHLVRAEAAAEEDLSRYVNDKLYGIHVQNCFRCHGRRIANRRGAFGR